MSRGFAIVDGVDGGTMAGCLFVVTLISEVYLSFLKVWWRILGCTNWSLEFDLYPADR